VAEFEFSEAIKGTSGAYYLRTIKQQLCGWRWGRRRAVFLPSGVFQQRQMLVLFGRVIRGIYHQRQHAFCDFRYCASCGYSFFPSLLILV